MNRDGVHFLLLNIGHFIDHFLMLIFATVAALALHREWGIDYAALVVYATPGFFAFGAFALPAGWLADRWSRDGMIAVFFTGVGLVSIVVSFAQTPMQIGLGLFLIGVFAAIYHPVGLAIVTTKWRKIGMRIAINGVWGNLGVASAALITGYLIDHGGWRMAFAVPGVISIGLGILYMILRWPNIRRARLSTAQPPPDEDRPVQDIGDFETRRAILRVSIIVFVTSALAAVVFQSTTFALPKMFDEQIAGLVRRLADWLEGSATPGQGDTATVIGALAFIVFAVASISQLIVGAYLDRHGPRAVYLVVAAIQIMFFAAMPLVQDAAALAVALGFMLGAFGQIPIGDYIIGKLARGPARARIFGVRYVVSFTCLAASLPLIALVHDNWGFDVLFLILASIAACLFVAATALPRTLPSIHTKPVILSSSDAVS